MGLHLQVGGVAQVEQVQHLRLRCRSQAQGLLVRAVDEVLDECLALGE